MFIILSITCIVKDIIWVTVNSLFKEERLKLLSVYKMSIYIQYIHICIMSNTYTHKRTMYIHTRVRSVVMFQL